jgi:hypothetical protein
MFMDKTREIHEFKSGWYWKLSTNSKDWRMQRSIFWFQTSYVHGMIRSSFTNVAELTLISWYRGHGWLINPTVRLLWTHEIDLIDQVQRNTRDSLVFHSSKFSHPFTAKMSLQTNSGWWKYYTSQWSTGTPHYHILLCLDEEVIDDG